MVERALWDLAFDRDDTTVTSNDLARYLKADEDSVEAACGQLTYQRLICRRGDGWKPWRVER